MVYMGVEMVEKVVVRMGCFGGKERKKKVEKMVLWFVVVVVMEEEMEENEVVVLVVKMEGEMVEKWWWKWRSGGRPRGVGLLFSFAGKVEKEGKYERERKKKRWGIYIWE